MNTYHALRLLPGQDMKSELCAYVRRHALHAACVVTCVGSVQRAMLRFAGRETATAIEGPCEIVALTGTLCPDGAHLHIALADQHGVVRGGHMMDGCMVYTTAEIVLASLPDIVFTREQDAATGYRELFVRPVQH